MFAFIEGLWYSSIIVFRLCFWPAVLIISVALLARITGAIVRAAKKKK